MTKNHFLFSFLDFKLVEVNFIINKDFSSEKEIELNSNLVLKHNWAKKEKSLSVFLKLEFIGKDSPFTLIVEGAGLFSFKGDVDAAHIEEVAKVNCAAIVFPYVRETVSDIIRRAGFPPLYLPPFNFVKAYKDRKEKETKDT